MREQDIFNPLHYLALLEQRPGAFEYAKPLKQWRRDWSPAYHRLLERLKQNRPDGVGVREFVQVLKLHQTYPAELVEQAVGLALSYGCAHFDGVKQCLHQLQQPQMSLPLLDLSDKPHLAELGQQPLDLGCYEQLLEKRG